MGNYLAGFGGDSYDVYQDREVIHGSVFILFFIGISANNTYSLYFQVYLIFYITQHKRDEQLIQSLIEYYDCRKVNKKE